MTDYAKYQRLRHWSDAYIDSAIAICGRCLLRVADVDMDQREACDLLTMTMQPVHIGVRVRAAHYAVRYPWEFTVRCLAGAESELQKIEKGFGDWLLYGFVADNGCDIARWFLIDLNALRGYWLSHPSGFRDRYFPEVNNRDGTAFRVFDVRRLPPDVVIASSVPIPREAGP